MYLLTCMCEVIKVARLNWRDMYSAWDREKCQQNVVREVEREDLRIDERVRYKIGVCKILG